MNRPRNNRVYTAHKYSSWPPGSWPSGENKTNACLTLNKNGIIRIKEHSYRRLFQLFAKRLDIEVRMSGFKTLFTHLISVWLWVTCFYSLSPSFLICKRGILRTNYIIGSWKDKKFRYIWKYREIAIYLRYIERYLYMSTYLYIYRYRYIYIYIHKERERERYRSIYLLSVEFGLRQMSRKYSLCSSLHVIIL